MLARSLAAFTFLGAFVAVRSSVAGRRSLRSAAAPNEPLDLACGGPVSSVRLDAVAQAVAPMWRALSKNPVGRLEQRPLRYLVQRYFSQQHGLTLRGLERQLPTRPLELEEVVRVIAALERDVFDADRVLLEHVYKSHGKATTQVLTDQALVNILEEYLVHWMMGDDKQGIEMLLGNRTFLQTAFPHWGQVSAFARGEIAAARFRRARAPPQGKNVFLANFTFEDAHEVVAGITSSFASFWNSECVTLKDALMEMDVYETGRVPLPRFYSTALNTEWRFGESEAYLRELGVLDESSAWRGKQVIIPNYVQGTSNCIVSTRSYMVCCRNECESFLAELEGALASPSAAPEQILELVRNMSSQTTLDHDAAPALEGSLTRQLQQIAEVHEGRVPLHGRLFAQWLHFAFPRECALPRRSSSALTPSEFGSSYLASGAEMERHAAAAGESAPGEADARTHWQSQWSTAEEELLEGDLDTTWEAGAVFCGGAALAVFLGLVGLIKPGASVGKPLLPVHNKALFI